MDVELRRCLLAALEDAAPRHKLPSLVHTTFLLRHPHSPTVAALDLVYAIMGLIEHETIPKEEGFQLSLSALETAPGECPPRRKGVTAARLALEAVSRVVHHMVSARQLCLAGPFGYFIVQERRPRPTRPHGLVRHLAANFTAVAVPRRTHRLARLDLSFEQAATKSGTRIQLDHMDSSVISLPTSQRSQFFDALTALLA
ncbi:Uncharacterized protein OBRU01_05679 [Operophtera brumata]|uniref:Uncharacterized protein n=1 Tax=Operophtera brumata TaxID=104452 RepID=A0A0L7LLV3_OPEBR|nr:Uncharacterized protein OBRU01_05679 [Operophtera brumata]